MTITLRPSEPGDEPFLWEMLYEAIYVPEGAPPFPREIVQAPGIRQYVQGWGKPTDMGVLALDEGGPVGAAWLRLLAGDEKGYGYVDENTPELSVAMLHEYRGQGIGGQLLVRLIEMAQPPLCGGLSERVTGESRRAAVPKARLRRRERRWIIARDGEALAVRTRPQRSSLHLHGRIIHMIIRSHLEVLLCPCQIDNP